MSTTFPHWWDGWVVTNAPAALESPGNLSGLATSDKVIVGAYNNALKILEDYHATGAVTQAKRLQSEAKVWSDLFAVRNKLLGTLSTMTGNIQEAQIRALQNQQEALLQARTALATRAATGDQATVAKVRAEYTTNGVDAALADIVPALTKSALLGDTDVGSAALPATFSGALQAANVDITDVYQISEAEFRKRLGEAGSTSRTAQDAAVVGWQRAKQTFGTLSDLDRTIDEDLRVVGSVFGPEMTGSEIAAAAMAASQEAEARLKERLPGFDDVAVAQLQQEALDTLEGYRLTKEAVDYFKTALTTEKASPQDQLAASPSFQAWARSHGFPNVGTKDADGNFVPGFDDYEATAEYIKQVLRKKPPMMGKHAGRDEYVQFEEDIAPGSAAAKAFDEEHQYAGKYIKDKETGKFLTREEIEARVAPPIMFVQGKKPGVEYFYNEGSDVAIRYLQGKPVTSIPREEMEAAGEPERAAIVDTSGEQVAVRPLVGRLRAGSDAEASKQVTDLIDAYGGFSGFSLSMREASEAAAESGVKMREEESAYAPVDIAREMRAGYRTPRNVEDGEVFTDPRKPDDGYRYRIVDGKAEYSEDGGEFRQVTDAGADAAIREVADFIKKPASQADADRDALDPQDALDPLSSDKSLEIVDEPPKTRTVKGIRKPTPAKYALQALPDEAIVVTDDGDVRVIKQDKIVESVPVDGIVGRGGQGELRATFGEPANPNAAIRFSGRSEASKERAKAERVERQKERFERQAEGMSPEQLAAEASLYRRTGEDARSDERITAEGVRERLRIAASDEPIGTPLPSQRLAGLESRIEDERKRQQADIDAGKDIPLSSYRRVARLMERADDVRARAPQPDVDEMLDAAVAQWDAVKAAKSPEGAPSVRATQTPAQQAASDLRRIRADAAESKRQRILAASGKGPDEVVRVTDRLRAYFKGDRAATRERSFLVRRAFGGADTLPEVKAPVRVAEPGPAGATIRRGLPGIREKDPSPVARERVVGGSDEAPSADVPTRSVRMPQPPKPDDNPLYAPEPGEPPRKTPVEGIDPRSFEDALIKDLGGGTDVGALQRPGERDVFKRLLGGQRGDAIPLATANQRTRIV
jgi:hypothetical protein